MPLDLGEIGEDFEKLADGDLSSLGRDLGIVGGGVVGGVLGGPAGVALGAAGGRVLGGGIQNAAEGRDFFGSGGSPPGTTAPAMVPASPASGNSGMQAKTFTSADGEQLMLERASNGVAVSLIFNENGRAVEVRL